MSKMHNFVSSIIFLINEIKRLQKMCTKMLP